MIALFGPSPGLGDPFPAEGESRDSWVLVLASKVSARLSAPGMGRRRGGSAGRGATIPSLALGPMAQGPASEKPVTLSPPLRLHFLHQKGRGGEEKRVLCLAPPLRCLG